MRSQNARLQEKAIPRYREIIRLHDDVGLSFTKIGLMWRITSQRAYMLYKRATDVLQDGKVATSPNKAKAERAGEVKLTSGTGGESPLGAI